MDIYRHILRPRRQYVGRHQHFGFALQTADDDVQPINPDPEVAAGQMLSYPRCAARPSVA